MNSDAAIVIDGVAHRPRLCVNEDGSRGGTRFTRYEKMVELPLMWPTVCTGERGMVFRRVWPVDRLPVCAGCIQTRYATEEERRVAERQRAREYRERVKRDPVRLEARRRSWRESKQRARSEGRAA